MILLFYLKVFRISVTVNLHFYVGKLKLELAFSIVQKARLCIIGGPLWDSCKTNVGPMRANLKSNL